MTTDRTAFRAAIAAHPDEDTPRLVFADWLDEHGEHDRAEFIRRHIEVVRGGNEDAWIRANELWTKHKQTWQESLCRCNIEPGHIMWDRGFINGILTSPQNFLSQAPEIFVAEPQLRSLDLGKHGISQAEVEALAACPQMAKITKFHLCGARLGPEGLQPMAASPHLRNIAELNLCDNNLGVAEVRQLVTPDSQLGNLCKLELESNNIMDEGAETLAASPLLATLTHLDLRRTRIGDSGARVILTSSQLQHLAALDLSCNRIGSDGVEVFTEDGCKLNNLAVLNLSENAIGDAGAWAIAASPHLKNLTDLNLRHNRIGVAGVQAIATSPHLSETMHIAINAFKGTKGELAASLGLRRNGHGNESHGGRSR